MAIKLSHSKASRYGRCPKSYELYYEKKIRSKLLGSPLWFGIACDEAINRLLLNKKKVLTEEELEIVKKTPLEIFDYHMRNATINKKDVKIKEYEHLQFSKADYDPSLLEDTELFEDLGEDRAFCEAHMEWYYAERKKKDSNISEEDTKIFNKINWYSLYEKGKMILEVYDREVMPEIHEVFEIQKPISLPNANGDEIIGFIDFIGSFVDAPNVKVIVDNKSSSKPYKQQDLDESDQLHTYAEAEGLEDICFIVYEKNIRKRDPRTRVTIWRGKIDDNHTEKVFDNYESILYGIKEEDYKANFESGCFFFGRKCEYYSICHHEKMGDMLEKVKKEK